MKKIISGLSLIIGIWITFALTSTDLKNKLNEIYNQYITQITQTYKNYLWKISKLEDNFSTGDYKILTYLTGIDFTGIKNTFKNQYTNTIKELTTEKYSIIANIETNDNNFKNGLILTWDYEDNLQNLNTEVENYENTSKNKAILFEKNLSWEYNNFSSSIENKLNYYKTDIQKYKDYKSLLNKLNSDFKDLQENYNKLQKIIGLSKEVFNEKSDKIKNFIDQYYSGLLENEFKKYLQQDENMIYFKSWFKLKKQILLGYINNQFNDTINKIIKSYYPDIDLNNLQKEIQVANNKSIKDIVSNYSTLKTWISSLEETIKKYQNKVNEKLQKFPKEDKESILKVLEKDLINFFNEATKVVQEDIKETLAWWLVFIQTREKLEQPLVEKLTQIYTKGIQSNNLNELEQLKTTIQSYKNVIILPTNKQIIENYLKSVEKKIQEVKYQEIKKTLENILNQLEMIPVWNKDKLEEIKQQFDNIKNQVKNINSEEIKQLVKNIELKIQLKENLNKLYDCWAIKFYYQYGNLSDTVANLLEKYYKKYKSEWKEKLFMEKINKALEKINILEQNLNPDIRSYYIIMIHNGLLKFKAELENNA